ncbi:YARHG domain-containing protein [Leptotrichia alba]|uniref:YARHG domain-containing protein n=1 Tax=Leptotrichia alba TaxID=3239304 RepID=A0AB39V2C7_9FUSO
MKEIKGFLLFCLMFLIGLNLLANDLHFESSGGHIVPMNMSNISIKSEKLHFKLQRVKGEYEAETEMVVTVRFVFNSPDAGEKYIGFITPEGGAYKWDEVEYFKDFKTIVNGKRVDTVSYRLTDLIPKDVKQLEEVKKYFKEYDKEKMMETFKYYKKSNVYYFKADFKKGENIVEHSYRYNKFVDDKCVDFDYVWTTISKWKDQKVDDFEVIVEPGSTFIEMPVMKMKNGKEIKWELAGEGNMDYGYKIYSYEDGKEDKDKYLYAKLKKGYLHFRTKDFKPESEFYLTAITSLDENHIFPEKTEKGFKLRDNFSDAGVTGTNLEYHLEHDLKNITDDELRIIRNYPFALAGYDFSDKKLKDYFSQFLWYIPIGKNVTLEKDEYEWIKKADNIINSRKK